MVKRPISTFDAIEAFLSNKLAGELVWVTDAIRAVRQVQPSCELQDDELEQVIARHAILHKCNVSFDRGLKRGADRLEAAPRGRRNIAPPKAQ